MLAENRRHIFLVRKTIIAIHPKLSKFLFSLLKLLFYDKISRRQHEQCSNTSDVFLALREKYGEDAALSLIYINLKFLKAEKALECFEGVSIPSVDIEQTPYDILLRDITQIVLIVGEKRVEELICYLAKVYLDDPHPDHVREWGVLGVFSQLIDGANIVPENGTDSLINSVEQVFDDRAILERCRDCVENGLTSGDEGEFVSCDYNVTGKCQLEMHSILKIIILLRYVVLHYFYWLHHKSLFCTYTHNFFLSRSSTFANC